MPTPRKPTALLMLNGSLEHDKKRHASRLREPQCTDPIGDPPPSLNKAQLAVWHELLSIAPARVLTKADRWTVEVAARLMYKVRKGWATSSETSQLTVLLGRMAMTPADRSKVQLTDEPADKDDLDLLLG